MHLIDSLALGGAERMLVDLANTMHDKGLQVSVCATRSDMTLASEIDPQIQRIALHRKSRFDIAGLVRLQQFIDQKKADLLHAHGLSTFSLLAFAKQIGLIQLPIVFHDHNGNIESNSKIPKWFKLWGHRYVSQYVGVSPLLADWARTAGVPSARINVIANGLDMNRLLKQEKGDLRSLCQLEADTTLAVVVGGIRPQKGLENLISIAQHQPILQSLHFAIIGHVQDMDYYHALQQQIHSSGMQSRFHFLGQREDAFGLMLSADFALLPSVSESGPLVLIEFMAAGLPFVAFCVGGVSRDAQQFGLPGFAAPMDIAAFAEETTLLYQMDSQNRMSRGAIGREYAIAHYDIRNRFGQWQTVYERALSNS